MTIRRGHIPGVPHRRAFALPGLIYLGADQGVVGATGAGSGRPRATPTLVHELVHVWQGLYLGPRYVERALGEQLLLGRGAYDWRAALDRAEREHTSRTGADGRMQEFPVEAHAQLVSDAYARRYEFGPVTALAGPGRDRRVMEEALTGLRAGLTPSVRGRSV